MLLGKKPKDFDIVTSAKPTVIEKLFKKTIPVGKKFGVIIVMVSDFQFEVATFRKDIGIKKGRWPKRVRFTSAEEDQKRRDFTINGMFYDPVNKKVIDYVDGQKDLKKKLIRFIGKPEERIKEDHLRILRAIRFKNTLGFKYHGPSWQAVKKYSSLIKRISAERIRDELNKMFLDENRLQAFLDLDRTGVLKQIIPEFEKMKGVKQPREFHREGDVWKHNLEIIKNLPKDSSLTLIWAALLHDIGKPDTFRIAERIRFDGHVEKGAEIANKILSRLRFSNREKDSIVWLIRNHLRIVNLPEMKLAKKRRYVMEPDFLELLALLEVDTKSSYPVHHENYQRPKRLAAKIKKEMPKKIPQLVNGNDLMRIFKLSPSPYIGYLLRVVEETQLEDKIKTKKQALALLKKEIKKIPIILRGKVVKGEGIGQKTGFPTANLEGNFPKVEFGVYAAFIKYQGKKYKGSFIRGVRPLYKFGPRKWEAYLIDFKGDLVGKTLEVEIVKKIRSLKKYKDGQVLVRRIKKDIQEIKKILK